MQKQDLVSIIIPTLNEEKHISCLLSNLQSLTDIEIIVCDGESSDKTKEICSHFPVLFLNSQRGRGVQLNAGAEYASGEILLFLHADSLIEKGVVDDIRLAVQMGRLWGCCSLAFNEPTLLFRIIGFFSNLRAKVFGSCCGDQGIYCQRDLFWKNGGFPKLAFLEDIGISKLLRTQQPPNIIKGKIITSTRRFRAQGIWKTVIKNQIIKILYSWGKKPEVLQEWYQGRSKEIICERQL